MNNKRILASFLSLTMIFSQTQSLALNRTLTDAPNIGLSKSAKIALAVGGGVTGLSALVSIPLLVWGLSKRSIDNQQTESKQQQAIERKSPEKPKNCVRRVSKIDAPTPGASIATWKFSMHHEHEEQNPWYKTLNGGQKFGDGEMFPTWHRGAKRLISGSASYLGDIVNGRLAPFIKEVTVDVYTDFAADKESSKCPGDLEKNSHECGRISELDQGRKILATKSDAKGKIALLDATNNEYKGGGPTRHAVQEESLVAKGALGISLLSDAAKLYYEMGTEKGHQPWNCIFAHDVVFYPESYLEKTVSMRQDLRPERIGEIIANPKSFYEKCDKFHVLGVAAPNQFQAGQILDLKANFVEQFRQIYSVAREQGVKYLVMVKFGTCAFAVDVEESQRIWKAAHDEAFKEYGGGIEEYIVDGPPCNTSDSANRSYFNRAVDALRKVEPLK